MSDGAPLPSSAKVSQDPGRSRAELPRVFKGVRANSSSRGSKGYGRTLPLDMQQPQLSGPANNLLYWLDPAPFHMARVTSLVGWGLPGQTAAADAAAAAASGEKEEADSAAWVACLAPFPAWACHACQPSPP